MYVCFGAEVKESWTDDAVDASLQKGSLLTDTACESASTSTEVEKLAHGSTSDTETASDWSELAGLSSAKKPQPATRRTQVTFSQKTCNFYVIVVLQ